MIFLTYWFFGFAAAFVPIYWLIRHSLARKLWLLAGCAVFHTHFAGPAGVIPIVILGVLTYFAGRSRRGPACLAGIVLVVGALVMYKYTYFLAAAMLGAWRQDLGQAAVEQARGWLPGAPPLAISFFAFEFVHYLYDVWHGSQPIRSPLDFALFSIFWPSIVAGPVKRYQQFLPALVQGASRVDPREAAEGFLRVLVGFLKKVLADSMTAAIATAVPLFDRIGVPYRWLAFTLIGFRILLDFSGYSDMAIGFARMLGVKLPENFNWPYLARSIPEFWQRWHISLSTWIRDYVYIPLGGNRHGPARRVCNGLLAFALCGLWHGAAWNFILWGLYHGVGLAVSISYRSLPAVISQPLARMFGWTPVAWLATMAFVGWGWLIFFYPVPEALRITRMMLGAAK